MLKPNNLIGTKSLDEIVETAIYTGHVADAIPVSVMLIGPPGAGKSKTLLKFNGEMLHRCDDLTSAGLHDILKEDEKEQKISHIVLSDFNAPLSHKPSTSMLLVANLLTLMADGTARIDDGRETKTLTHSPIGILTAVTTDMYSKNEYKWKVLGFKRRFLPIFYDYSEMTILRVQSIISRGRVTSLPLTPRPIIFKGPKKIVKLASREASLIKELSTFLAQMLSIHTKPTRDDEKKIKYEMVPGKALLPYSPHLILQAMARGNALRLGRSRVNSTDIRFLSDLLSFCRYGEPKRL